MKKINEDPKDARFQEYHKMITYLRDCKVLYGNELSSSPTGTFARKSQIGEKVIDKIVTLWELLNGEEMQKL